MSNKSRGYYAIGRITKAFGIRGEVVVRPETTPGNRFAGLKTVMVGMTEHDARQASVVSVLVQPHGVRMTLEGVSGRTEAENLVGSFVFVKEEDRVGLPKGTYFVHDVVGMQVVDQEGGSVGTVREVLHMPANDVYVIDGMRGEIMLPAVREFVKAIDVDAKRMQVHLIEGMDWQ